MIDHPKIRYTFRKREQEQRKAAYEKESG